ncbi:MAG: hypothetical protein HYR73_05000, partial [Candidatus Eisenbacteria bacterium]|nr:hypothetical protein [Candidatus Eisenbacteria bacterium]
GITRSLDDPKFREQNSREFEKAVADSRKQVESARTGLSEEAKARLLKEGADPKTLDDVFIFSADGIKGGDVFSSWGGPASAHNKPLQMSFKSLPEGRTQLIVAKPNGQAPVDLKPLGEWLNRANQAKAERMGVALPALHCSFTTAVMDLAMHPP